MIDLAGNQRPGAVQPEGRLLFDFAGVAFEMLAGVDLSSQLAEAGLGSGTGPVISHVMCAVSSDPSLSRCADRSGAPPADDCFCIDTARCHARIRRVLPTRYAATARALPTPKALAELASAVAEAVVCLEGGVVLRARRFETEQGPVLLVADPVTGAAAGPSEPEQLFALRRVRRAIQVWPFAPCQPDGGRGSAAPIRALLVLSGRGPSVASVPVAELLPALTAAAVHRSERTAVWDELLADMRVGRMGSSEPARARAAIAEWLAH